MSRSQRLLQMMQLMRSMTPPLRGEDLARELGISIRSVYRDIDTLRSSGAVIDGEAGFGYTLVEDPALPPMMFSRDEIEALVLGLREVQEVADPVLAEAARNALSKVRASLPDRMRMQFEHSVLHAKRFHSRPEISIDVASLREAAREELAIDIAYGDEAGRQTQRRVQPLAIVFLDQTLMLLAWCQLRSDFRSFRIDRIREMVASDESFRPKRVPLLREFLARMDAEMAGHAKD
jgi:predicted DNA-binding transcriptional regulator YafY